jgi:hypothetical protein
VLVQTDQMKDRLAQINTDCVYLYGWPPAFSYTPAAEQRGRRTIPLVG